MISTFDEDCDEIVSEPDEPAADTDFVPDFRAVRDQLTSHVFELENAQVLVSESDVEKYVESIVRLIDAVPLPVPVLLVTLTFAVMLCPTFAEDGKSGKLIE